MKVWNILTALVLLGACRVEAVLTTNSWTNSVSGKWEGAINWSAGSPTNSNAANFIANATNKTVTIDATTVLSNGVNGCLTISNLTVSGQLGTTNTLFLNNAGLVTPLSVRSTLTIRTNGILRINTSAVRVDSYLAVGGNVLLESGALTTTNALALIGALGVSQITVSNGTWLAGSVSVYGFSRLTIAGGTNTLLSSLSIGAQDDQNGGGGVFVEGGLLVVTNGSTIIGCCGDIGGMFVNGGTWLAQNVTVGTSGSDGYLTVAGGSSSVYSSLIIGDDLCAFERLVEITGGGLFVTNAAGNAVLELRAGNLYLGGGTLIVDKIVLTNACGSFIRSGGTLIYGSAVLDPNRDDDGDGISNGYEQSHGLDPLNAADANIDSDGDGLSNLQEFLAGTDATNSASAFRITSISRVGTNVLVTWTMGTGKTNALQRTAGAAGSFATNNFTTIFTVTNTIGSVTNYLDLGAATNVPAFYYRIRLVP